MQLNNTLVIIKPDITSRKLIGEIVTIFENCSFDIVHMESMFIDEQSFDLFYEQLKNENFFADYKASIVNKMVVVLLLHGDNVLPRVRTIAGATNPTNAAAGTIRGMYGVKNGFNCVHASDSYDSFMKEKSILFGNRF